jgi:hypothetical protein
MAKIPAEMNLADLVLFLTPTNTRMANIGEKINKRNINKIPDWRKVRAGENRNVIIQTKDQNFEIL